MIDVPLGTCSTVVQTFRENLKFSAGKSRRSLSCFSTSINTSLAIASTFLCLISVTCHNSILGTHSRLTSHALSVQLLPLTASSVDKPCLSSCIGGLLPLRNCRSQPRAYSVIQGLLLPNESNRAKSNGKKLNCSKEIIRSVTSNRTFAASFMHEDPMELD